MIRKFLITLTIIILTNPISRAQVVFRSVEDVWKYADDHSVTIRIAKYEAQKADFNKKQSYSALLPQASATASYTDNLTLQTTVIPGIIFGKPGEFIPVRFGQQFIYNEGITAQMDILNLQSWFNVRIAKTGKDVSKDSLANTRKNVYQQIATQYYSLLLMQEAARLSGQSEMIADSVYQSTNNKFAEGTVSKANVDIAKINLDRAQQTNITSQYQVQTTKNNLKALLDMSVNDSLIVDATLQNSISNPNDASFTEDPLIKLAYHQVQQTMEMYKSGNAAYLPTISIMYNDLGQQYANQFQQLGGGAQWYPASYWSLRASWNLFNGGSRYFQSKKNKVAIDERQLMYENTQKQSAISDENLRLSYAKTAALLTKAEEVMQLSFDNYSHISDRYNAGLSSLDDRLNAFSDYITYQNQYLNSLSDMLVQLYQIKIRQQSF